MAMNVSSRADDSVRILSLDGGGIRGLSSLLILERLMDEISKAQGLEHPVRPCEFFDLIGGTSTGGIIAIMLGRLRMTVEQCIEEYKALSGEAFTPKRTALLPARPRGAFSATSLEHAIQSTCRKYCSMADCARQRQEETDKLGPCDHEAEFRDEACTKTVVLATTKDDVNAKPTLFRTYDTSAKFRGCKIWEVARATSAATTFFKPIRIGRDGMEFIDAGLGHNNPCEILVREALKTFEPRDKLQILSIGTGAPDPKAMSDSRLGIVQAMKAMVTSSQSVATRMDEKYGDNGQYFRFNVERGVGDILLSDWRQEDKISSLTHNYLDEPRQSRSIIRFVQHFTNTTNPELSQDGTETTVTSTVAPSTTPVHLVPLPRSKYFVHRPEAQALVDLLYTQDKRNIAAVWGLGGTGKTQLAVHLAEWVKTNQPKCSVFWVPAYSAASFEQGYLEIAKSLGVGPTRDNKDFKASVRQRLSSEEARPWLLIVDNADNLEDLGSSDDHTGLMQYLPRSPVGSVLFTTRSRDVALHVADDAIIQVGPMSTEDAQALLRSSLHDKAGVDDAIHIQSLLVSMANLPLAIVQASAYLNRNRHVSIKKYLRKLQGTEESLATVMHRDFHDPTRYTALQNATASTWLVSFDEIQRTDAYASYLLCFMSCIEPVAIPLSLLPDPGHPDDLDNAIGTLLAYAFLASTNNCDVFEMHSLVHASARSWMKTSGLQPETLDKVIQHMDIVFPSIDHRNRYIWKQFIPHTLRALSYGAETNKAVASRLYEDIGRCFKADGRYVDAIECFKAGLRLQEDCPDTQMSMLDALHELALAYHEAGRTKDAIRTMEQVVEGRRSLGDDEHPDYLTAQQALAASYWADGRLAEATSMLETIVKTREVAGAGGCQAQLSTLHHLAGAYISGGRAKDAITISELVVSKRVEFQEAEHPELLAAQHVLASAYLAEGRVEEAIRLLESVRDTEQRMLNDNHPDRLESQHVLASAYLAAGQVDRAVCLLEYVVEKQQGLGEDHPSLLCTQHVLAQAYGRTGCTQAAIELLERVVRVEAGVLHEGHPSRAASERELGLARERHAASLIAREG